MKEKIAEKKQVCKVWQNTSKEEDHYLYREAAKEATMAVGKAQEEARAEWY